MTISEFNAWLEGYGEAIGDAPTPEQWEKIKAKLATVKPFFPPAPTVVYPGGIAQQQFRYPPANTITLAAQ